MDRVLLSVIVSDAFRSRLPEVADRVQAAGMALDSREAPLGVFTGSVDASKLPELERVEGVQRVKPARRVSIGG